MSDDIDDDSDDIDDIDDGVFEMGTDETDEEGAVDEDELSDEEFEAGVDMDLAARSLLNRPRRQRKGRRHADGQIDRPIDGEPGGRPDGEPARHGPIQRLYRGETSFDFVGRRRVWFTLSTVIIVAGIISIILRGGLNLGIEFKGGVEWTVKAPGITQVQATKAMASAGLNQPVVQLLGHGSAQQLNVQADLSKLSASVQAAEENKVADALATLTHSSVANAKDNFQSVGPTWGSSVTNKAIEALVIFFLVVGAYISIRFEPKMALSAFIAMVHDVLVAVGVYSLFNFQVTPDTVVAILTILGYSLYDTVVVFDRVRDNTKNIGSQGRITYSQLINLSMNQTLARSINTSAVAIIPVLAVLLIGAELLGASTLQEYGLALFVGLLSGAYSSIFIASPILSILKGREARWVAIEQRVNSRGDRDNALSPAAAAALSTQISIAAGGQTRAGGTTKRTGPIRPGSASGSGSSAGGGRGQSVGRGTVVLDRPAENAGGNRQPPRPRKNKGKRKR